MINPAGQVYNWSGTAWVNQVAYTAADGSMWFLGSTMPSAPGYRYVYHFSAGQLVQAPGAGSGIGIGDGSVWMINPAGQVYNWSGTAWVNQVAYTAADGSMWFLGTINVDSAGDHPIYCFNHGQLTKMLGTGTQLAVNGGTVYAVDTGGGSALPGLGGIGFEYLTPIGNGLFSVQVGTWLQATVSIQYDSTGTATLSFSNVLLNTGAFLGKYLSPILAQVDQIAQALSPLTQVIFTLPSDFGGNSFTTADLLREVLSNQGYNDKADQIGILVDLENTLQGLSSVATDLGSIQLDNFSTQIQVSGSHPLIPALMPSLALPPVLTQLGQQLAGAGINLPALTDPSIFLALLSGDPSVTVATYTAPPLALSVGDISATLASFPVAVAVSVNGNAEASLSAQLGGTIGVTASGQLSASSNFTLSVQGNVGLALELAVGYAGFNAGGYALFAGVGFQSQLSAGPNGVSFTPPTATPTFHAGWVGPDFDIQALVRDLSAAGQRLSDAITNSEQQVSSAISNATQQVAKATQNTPLDPKTWDVSKW